MQIQVHQNHDGSFESHWIISGNIIPCSWTAREFASFTGGSEFSVLVTGHGPDGKVNSQVEKTFKLKEVEVIKHR